MTPMPYSTEIVQDGDYVMVLFSDDSIEKFRCPYFDAKRDSNWIRLQNRDQIQKKLAEIHEVYRPRTVLTPKAGTRVPGLSYGSDSLASRYGYWGR